MSNAVHKSALGDFFYHSLPVSHGVQQSREAEARNTNVSELRAIPSISAQRKPHATSQLAPDGPPLRWRPASPRAWIPSLENRVVFIGPPYEVRNRLFKRCVGYGLDHQWVERR